MNLTPLDTDQSVLSSFSVRCECLGYKDYSFSATYMQRSQRTSDLRLKTGLWVIKIWYTRQFMSLEMTGFSYHYHHHHVHLATLITGSCLHTFRRCESMPCLSSDLDDCLVVPSDFNTVMAEVGDHFSLDL